MKEHVYIRSASLDCEYRWYRLRQQVTQAYAHHWNPPAWGLTSRWLVQTKPCLAVVRYQGRFTCIFTGLRSHRQDNGRLIYDTLIVETEADAWSNLQQSFLVLALCDRQKESPLSPLSQTLHADNTQGLAIKAPEWLETLEQLAEQGQFHGRSLTETNGINLPTCVLRDDLPVRQALAKQLINITPGSCSEGILAIVTSAKSPQQLQNQARWALTTHSQAPSFEAIAAISKLNLSPQGGSTPTDADDASAELKPNTAIRLLTLIISFFKTWLFC